MNADLHRYLHCSFAIVLTARFRIVNILIQFVLNKHPTKSLRKRTVGRLFHNMPLSVPEWGSVWRADSKHRCLRTILNKRRRLGFGTRRRAVAYRLKFLEPKLSIHNVKRIRRLRAQIKLIQRLKRLSDRVLENISMYYREIFSFLGSLRCVKWAYLKAQVLMFGVSVRFPKVSCVCSRNVVSVQLCQSSRRDWLWL